MNILAFNPLKSTPDDTKALQSFLVTKHFYPRELGIDGDFGDGTKRALGGYKAACGGGIADVAYSQIGAEETPRGSNNGPIINLYMDATGDRGNREPWCADFICWAAQRWAENTKTPPDCKMPRTASAFEFEDYAATIKGAKALKPGQKSITPQRGDFIIYKFSHIGVLWEVGKSGTLHVVEGNTNDDGSREGYKVCLHPRYIAAVRSIVRLPQVA